MTVSVRFDLPPERALDFFRKKGMQTSFAWQDMMRQEHDAAFTVAKMMDMDLLKDVREAVDQAIAKGTSLADFRAQIEPMLAERGWWGKKEMVDPLTGKTRLVQLGSPRRIETIYQTNLRTAYAAGHWSAIVDNAEQAPFLMYDAILDERTRPDHRAWDGTLLPVDHKWWRDHYPPNGWRCRCSVIQMSRRQAQRLLKKDGPDRAPPTKTRDWVNPRTGEVEQVPIGIDPGWNYHPGMDRVPALQQQFREKAKPAGEIGDRALKSAGLRNSWDTSTATGRLHEEHFKEAPQWMKPAIADAGNVVVDVHRGKSYYKSGQRYIALSRQSMESTRGGGVWRHEFGHHLDWHLGGNVAYRSSRADFTDAMEKDAKEMITMSGLGRRSKAQTKQRTENFAAATRVTDEIAGMEAVQRESRLRELAKSASLDLDELENWLDKHGGYLGTLSRRSIGRDAGVSRLLVAFSRRDAQGFLDALDGVRRGVDGSMDFNSIVNQGKSYWHGSASHLSDMFSAATNKKVEGGGAHPAAYYRRAPYRRQAETWANITDVVSTGNIGQRILDQFTPSLFKSYRQIVSGG